MTSYTLNDSEMIRVVRALKGSHDEYCMCSDHTYCEDLRLAVMIEAELEAAL